MSQSRGGEGAGAENGAPEASAGGERGALGARPGGSTSEIALVGTKGAGEVIVAGSSARASGIPRVTPADSSVDGSGTAARLPDASEFRGETKPPHQGFGDGREPGFGRTPDAGPAEKQDVLRSRNDTNQELPFDTDVEAGELEARQQEAREVFQARGRERSRFGREVGQTTHSEIQASYRTQKETAGKLRGKDFQTEFVMTGPDGREHRADAVDFQDDRITEIKPAKPGETVGDIIERHGEQLEGYIEAYGHTTGRPPKEIEIQTYRSTKELWNPGEFLSPSVKDACRPEISDSAEANQAKAEAMLKNLREQGLLYRTEAELNEDRLFYQSLQKTDQNA